jgi:hypothetical protein
MVLLVQNAMYGGPLKSGYGNLSLLFTPSHIWPNLLRYPSWLLATETPIVLLALAAPFVVPSPSKAAWWLLVFSTVTLACYLPYVVFDAWWYLRFVLPAVGAILALTAASTVWLMERLGARWRAPVFALACGVLAVLNLSTAARRQVFELRDLEQRYRIAGEYIAAYLPADAAVVTVHQSGSVRFYSGRLTLVWAEIDPASLDRALQYLRSRNYHPYLSFETWEEPAFRKRFERASAIGRLEWPPIAEIDRQVRIYDPADYERYMRGGSVRTDRVWTRKTF